MWINVRVDICRRCDVRWDAMTFRRGHFGALASQWFFRTGGVWGGGGPPAKKRNEAFVYEASDLIPLLYWVPETW